jgi:hypothetical protein
MAAVQRQAAPAVGLSGGPVQPDLAVAPPRHVAPGGSATVARLSLPSPPRLSFAEPAAPEAVQRIPDVPDMAPPSLPAGEMPDVGAAAGTAAGAAGSAASALGGALGNDQLEELAKGLYDKIRQRLKAELRLDRERYGRVTDLAR